jgi:fructuronate reductase
MMARLLTQRLLDDREFWQGKGALLPAYRRMDLPVRSLCFSAGKMAYGHTGDILQDLLNINPSVGVMVGIETFAARYCADLASSDYLMTQLIVENEKDKITPKIQGAIRSVVLVDGNTRSLTWARLMELARDPAIQFATINAPEGAYGVSNTREHFATPASDAVKRDVASGSVDSDLGKWTAFARERFAAGLPFALVSCTNFSGNGHVTASALRMMGREWEARGHAPKGFLGFLEDPRRFSFPNTMIDRIAVPADAKTDAYMAKLDIVSSVVVTERLRYWVVEDAFPAGRPPFERAAGVIMEPSYDEVKKYEDMKLRILNMSHSTIAGLGVLLGYRGPYAIERAMKDPELSAVISRIVSIVIRTIGRPTGMDPQVFARDTMERLANPNIPDDPMRIAFNASTKMLPRFLDTYFAGRGKGMSEAELDIVLLPVAGFLRYCLGEDDERAPYELADDPIKPRLAAAGKAAKLGQPDSVAAFRELVASPDVMGKDLYGYGSAGKRLEAMARSMLAGAGAVRTAVREALKR